MIHGIDIAEARGRPGLVGWACLFEHRIARGYHWTDGGHANKNGPVLFCRLEV